MKKNCHPARMEVIKQIANTNAVTHNKGWQNSLLAIKFIGKKSVAVKPICEQNTYIYKIKGTFQQL